MRLQARLLTLSSPPHKTRKGGRGGTERSLLHLFLLLQQPPGTPRSTSSGPLQPGRMKAEGIARRAQGRERVLGRHLQAVRFLKPFPTDTQISNPTPDPQPSPVILDARSVPRSLDHLTLRSPPANPELTVSRDWRRGPQCHKRL